MSQDLEDIWWRSEQTWDLKLVSVEVVVPEARYKTPLMSFECKLGNEVVDAEKFQDLDNIALGC